LCTLLFVDDQWILSGTVGDAWEILANTGGERGQPSWLVRSESAAGYPGGARLDELGSLLSAWLLCGPWGHCFSGEITAEVLMTTL
jgi:hypothetical protein